MNLSSLDKLTKDVYDNILWYCSVPGVNKDCIVEYIIELRKTGLDFNLISEEWITSVTIKSKIGFDEFDLTLLDCFISKEDFEEEMCNDFGIYNPVVYELAKEAAMRVKNKLVTYDSRIEFFTMKLEDAAERMRNASQYSPSDLKSLQFKVEYYQGIIDTINEKRNKTK